MRRVVSRKDVQRCPFTPVLSSFGPIDTATRSQEDEGRLSFVRVPTPGSDLAPLTFTHADLFVERRAERCRE